MPDDSSFEILLQDRLSESAGEGNSEDLTGRSEEVGDWERNGNEESRRVSSRVDGRDEKLLGRGLTSGSDGDMFSIDGGDESDETRGESDGESETLDEKRRVEESAREDEPPSYGVDLPREPSRGRGPILERSWTC